MANEPPLEPCEAIYGAEGDRRLRGLTAPTISVATVAAGAETFPRDPPNEVQPS